MAWRIALSLEILRHQLNAAFPRRSKVSDGGIGDTAHASRNSDHNPWIKDPHGKGVVTARDFTHDPRTGIDCNWLADQLVKSRDPRIKYLIWNRKICSSKTAPWTWRPYSGVNAHTKHLHISVDSDPALYDGTAKWTLEFPDDTSDDVARVDDDILELTPVSAAAPAAEPAGSHTPESSNDLDSDNPQEPLKAEPPSDLSEKQIVAPSPDGSMTKTTTMTIAGFVVPASVVTAIEVVRSIIEQGFVAPAQIGGFVVDFIKSYLDYIPWAIAFIVAVILVKKLTRQITLWVQMIIQANPNWHNVKVQPARESQGWFRRWIW